MDTPDDDATPSSVADAGERRRPMTSDNAGTQQADPR